MASTIFIRVTRTVRLRGGRSIACGLYAAERTEGGFTVAHPSGIEGARAFVPSRQATPVASVGGFMEVVA